MFTDTDYDKLRQLMAQNPDDEELLQKLLDSHRETISTISHEIRNPLTIVYSTLQLIQSQHPEVCTFKYWDSLCGDVTYMKHLLEELTCYNHSTTLSFTEFDSRNFMNHLALSFASLCAESPVEFSSRIDSRLPAIQADGTKLREAFLNLLSNARDAILQEGTITLDATYDDAFLIITIKDSGSGISIEELPHIFTPFVSFKKGGTGLGLSITKSVLDAHNARIDVDSTPSAGTTFTVWLPVQQKR